MRQRLHLVAGLLALAATSSPALAAHYDVFVYSVPVSGEETVFDQGQPARIAAALKLPGFKTAQRFAVKDSDTPNTLLGNYFTIYGVETDDIDAASDALAKLGRAPGELSTAMSIYAPMGPVKHVPADVPGSTTTPLAVPGKTQMLHYFHFAHLNAGPGDEEKIFNDAYDQQHFPDVLRNPGFLWGQREKLVANKTPYRGAPAYLVVYEFQTYDLRVTMDEVRRRLKVGLTHAFPPGSTAQPTMTAYALPLSSDHS